MSQMLDRLLRRGFNVAPCLRPQREWTKWSQAIDRQVVDSLARLRQDLPVVVVADNVAEYFYIGTNQEVWDLTVDFPCLAPPWKSAWIEFRMPAKIVSCECGVTPITPEMGSHRAVLMETLSNEYLEQAIGMRPPADSHWTQFATSFIELGKGDIFQVGLATWSLRKDGTVIDPGDGKWLQFVFGLAAAEEILGHEKALALGNAMKDGFLWPVIHVAALTYSFINCRNTVIVDHAPDPTLRKAALKRGHPPMVEYKTLEIQAVKKILSEHGNVETNGLQKALHICRGHFKDYREHGLFGKHRNLFWWDMHVRGTIKEGMVDKEYAMPVVKTQKSPG